MDAKPSPLDLLMQYLPAPEAAAVEAELRPTAEAAALPAEVVDATLWLRTEPPPVDPVLVDTFDTGDKVCVIGASKTRKSFYVGQMALCIAAGRDFLAWRVASPRRVLVIQMEIQERHYWRRVRSMAKALSISPEDLEDRLHVVNARGVGVRVEHLRRFAEAVRAEVVIVDPLYKLYRGDENSAGDMAALLAWFDELAKLTGAAVVYVHHDAKGSPGDRDTRDRGSGSGVLGRDYDACMTLTEHRDEEGAAVVQALLRNYPPQTGFAASWSDGCFLTAHELEAVAATSKSKAERRERGPGLGELAERVRSEVLKRPWRVDELKAEIQRRYDVGRMRSEDVCRLLTGREDVETARTGTFPARVFMGPPKVTEAEATRVTKQWRNREIGL